MPHFLRHEAPTQDTEAACNVAKEVDRKYAVSDGEEGIGNVVVIGLIPSAQGLCLSPEELRYIIVLFYQDGAPSTVGIGVETTTQPRFWSNTDSEVSLFELTDGSAWKLETSKTIPWKCRDTLRHRGVVPFLFQFHGYSHNLSD